jgi:hypothetical protein
MGIKPKHTNITSMINANPVNQPLVTSEIIPSGTLLWYWDPLSREQEQVMLLEDLDKERYTYLGMTSVLYKSMKKTVWISNLCMNRFDKKPGINPCQEIPLKNIDVSTTYSGNTVAIKAVVKPHCYPHLITTNEIIIK